MNLKKFNFKNVKSTNDLAIRIIKNTNNKSGIVIAENQKMGRGRYGKKWISYKGNLFVSIFFTIDKINLSLKELTKLNCLLVKKLLSFFYKGKILIKKPNDLLIEDKKICGILQEVIDQNNEKFLITGIGINTLIAPIDNKFVSTCLRRHTKKNIQNLEFIKKIKIIYEKMINDLNNNNFTYVKKKYI